MSFPVQRELGISRIDLSPKTGKITFTLCGFSKSRDYLSYFLDHFSSSRHWSKRNASQARFFIIQSLFIYFFISDFKRSLKENIFMAPKCAVGNGPAVPDVVAGPLSTNTHGH